MGDVEHQSISTSELAQAFENAPVGMAVAVERGRILHSNAAFASMLGYTVAEITGKTVNDLTHPDDLGASHTCMDRLERREIPHFSLEKRYVHKRGSVVWARVYVSPLTSTTRTHYLLHAEDITREKSTIEALGETQARFREMADAIDQDFWIMSIEPLRLLYVSPAASRIWGFDPFENRDQPGRIWQHIHPEDVHEFGKLFGSLLTDAREREYRIIRPDGAVRWLRSRVYPVRDTSGTVYRIAGVTEDVTARKETEQALARHRAFERLVMKLSTEFVNLSAERVQEGFEAAIGELGTLIDADRGVIFLIDDQQQLAMKYIWRAPSVTDVPIAFTAFAFDPSSELRQTIVRDGLLCVDDVTAMSDALADVRARVMANGMLSTVGVPLTSHGELIGFFGYGTVGRRTSWPPDVTGLLKIAAEMFSNAIARLRSEEAMRTHRDALAHVLRVGTMGQLASGIAHELNQPLAAILSYARGCERRLATGDVTLDHLREVLRKIGDQAVRAADVIKTLRALVRKGEGRRAWRDANELVRAAIALIEPEIADSGIELVVDETSGLPAVQVDPIQIEQVVLNLVRNAADALEAAREPAVPAAVSRNGAKPLIRVATRLCAPGTVEVSVADNGPGITARDADFIFDEFYTTKTDGLGLGLSISRSIIEAHGGRLWMDAAHVPGSRFRFTLPAAG